MSFTLNRVYTEWYRNKGYSFTITSSTAYDQKFMYGRNIYQSISDVVDEMFQNYLSRPNVRQPILTQYCDGQRVTCSNWLSQWGSKYLGDQNYETIEILRYYYGNNMFINTAEEVSGIPASWPRVDLSVGSTGEKVRQIRGTAGAHLAFLPGHSDDYAGRNLRAGNQGGGGAFPEYLRTSGHGSDRLSNLVPYFRDLCRGYAHCGAGLEVGFSPVCDRISYKLGTFWRILWRITG